MSDFTGPKQHRRDSQAGWESNNYTLKEGEVGYDTDSGSFKIGDGSTAWNSLHYTLDWPYESQGTNYTFTDRNTFIATAAITVNLPALAGNGRRLYIIHNGSSGNVVTADGNGAETITAVGTSQATFDLEEPGTMLELVDISSTWIAIPHNFEILDIGGTLEAVYTKALTGTTNAAATTNVAHGIGDVDKILPPSGMIFQSTASVYFVYDNQNAATSADAFLLRLDATNVVLTNVGANLQSENYRIELRYWV